MRKLLLFVVPILMAIATFASTTQAAGANVNLVPNSSVEATDPAKPTSPQSWSSDTYGKNTAQFSYMNNDAKTGKRSLYVKVTAYTDGDSKWIFAPVAVKPNTTYSVSDMYKSSVATQVMVRVESTSGAVSYEWLKTAPKADGWKQLNTSFKTKADTKTLSIFHLINKKGWLQIDDMLLAETGSSAPTNTPATTTPPVTPPITLPATNLLTNPSFETAKKNDPTAPEGWAHAKSGTNNAAFTYMNSGHSGSRSVKMQITNWTSGGALWEPDAVPVKGGSTYAFSAWTMGSVGTEIDAEITLSNGTVQYQYVGWSSPSPNGWQKFYTNFKLPANAVKLSFYHYIGEKGWLQIDDYSISEFNPVGFNSGMVSLTFDDGLLSNKDTVAPLLKSYNFPATFYIQTSEINKAGNMTGADLKAIYQAGHEIAAHTVTHPHLPTVTPSVLASELNDAKASLQAWTGAPVNNFATPFGEYNADVLTAIMARYRSHRSVDTGFNSKDNFDISNIKVQNIYNTTTGAQMAEWVQYAKQTKTWLVLVYHAVEEPAPGQFDTTPTLLKAHLDAIKNSGLQVVTVEQALNQITPQL